MVYEVLPLVAGRTKFHQKYSQVLDSDSEWARVCRSLITVRDGAAARPRLLERYEPPSDHVRTVNLMTAKDGLAHQAAFAPMA